jgi:H+/gluconate symporter-like permease
MFDGIGSFLTFIWYGFLVGVIAVIILGIVLLFNIFGKQTIKSDKIIKPKLELVIKDNKIDTVYVYEKL